jgi:hypothetical protein
VARRVTGLGSVVGSGMTRAYHGPCGPGKLGLVSVASSSTVPSGCTLGRLARWQGGARPGKAGGSLGTPAVGCQLARPLRSPYRLPAVRRRFKAIGRCPWEVTLSSYHPLHQ